MIKRTLYFGNPCYLRKKDMQLAVEFPDHPGDSSTVPIEDIGVVVLDHPQITITNALIIALNENNTAVLGCDASHLPLGLMLPMYAHHAFTERMRDQIESSIPLRKNMWQQTVEAKIRNQACLLEKMGVEPGKLSILSQKVKSGDPENIEGQAASLYWERLFAHIRDFTRNRYGEPPNNLLNYGYAVLRAIIARNLAASGMILAVGIHHRNKYNPFCLADDIMEPYRPYVDSVVFDILGDTENVEELTPAVKKRLLSIPVIDIFIEDKQSPLMVGTQRTTASVAACFEGASRKLLYPEMK